MKSMKLMGWFLVLALVVVAGLVFGSPAIANLCKTPLGNQQLCYRMQALQGHVELVDAQRDMMQTNFDYLAKITQDMLEVMDLVLASGAPGAHREPLEQVRATVSKAHIDAMVGNSNALATVNSIRHQCMTCHSNTNPASGVKWDEISTHRWENIIPRCNENGKNPYLCKSMHAMLSNVAYFAKSYQANLMNFEAMEAVAKEIKRLATELLVKNITHKNPAFLDEVRLRAEEIQQLADERNPVALQRGFSLTQACADCHSSR